ncbi:hypothetical protein TI05_06890 [Achromatium sp. WMS3]|nr:hypothetical protein TI05_06890 [Achromatium sp. WMS3]
MKLINKYYNILKYIVFISSLIVYGLPNYIIADVQNDIRNDMSGTDSSTIQEPEPQYIPEQEADSITDTVPDIEPPAPQVIEGAGQTIQVDRIEFTGSTVFSQEQLQAEAKSFTGQALDSADLEELRYRLTRRYVENGYINSGAIIKGYDPKTKVLHIHLKEGSIKDIRVDTQGLLNPEYVRGRLRIYSKAPFHLPTMQERFLLLLDDPAIKTINGGIAPSTVPGEAILETQVLSNDPFSLIFTFDNRGAVSSGEKQGSVHAILRNLSGWGEEVTFVFKSNEDNRYGLVALNTPINYYDTRLHISYQRSTMAVVQEPLDILDIKGDYRAYNLGLTHPLIHTLKRSVLLGVNVGHKTNTTWLQGDPICFSQGCDDATGTSSISIVALTQRWTERSYKYVYTLNSVVTIGVDAFGTTQYDISNPGVNSQFASWLLQQSYARQWYNRRLQFIGRLDMQFADSPLPALQQTAVGGATSVRGYRENALIRDQVILGSVELRYGLLRPAAQAKYGNLQGAVFSDFAQAWNKDSRPAIRSQSVHSIGLGILWSWKDAVSAQVYWGHQLKSLHTKKGGSWQEDGIHASVQVVY